MDLSSLNEYSRCFFERLADEFEFDEARIEIDLSSGTFSLEIESGFISKTGENRDLTICTKISPDRIEISYVGWDAVISADQNFRYAGEWLKENEIPENQMDFEEAVKLIGDLFDEKLVVSVSGDKIDLGEIEGKRIKEKIRSWRGSYDKLILEE